jgi:Haem-binding domain
MKTTLRIIAVTLGAVLLMQLVPVRHDNPPVTAPLAAPPPVAATLRRACYDCHSHETVWPGYSRVAPASWLIARDVHEGREHVNFSTWESLPPAERSKQLMEIAEQVERGAMPPGIYTPLHPEARLSLEDIRTVATWARETASTAPSSR